MLLIAGMALTGLAAQTAYIRGLSMGDASLLSTLDYLRLPMTAAVDAAVFRALPGPAVWLGAVVIIGSTLYIAWRERRSGTDKGAEP